MAIDHERVAQDAYWAISPDARRIPSSQFRVAYVTIDEPVAVTANGRVIAYYIPVRPAPRSAQQVEPSGDGSLSRGAGRSEAPVGLAVSGASTDERPARASTTGRGAGQSRTRSSSATPPTAMTQAERDKVLRKVNRSGSER